MATKKPKKVNSPLKFSTPWLPNDAKNRKELEKATKNSYKIGKNPYQKNNDALHKKFEKDLKPSNGKIKPTKKITSRRKMG